MFAKLYLEITSRCNLACSFCPGTTRPAKFLTVEEFTILARRLRPHGQYLYFHVMGEPLLHPQLPELLQRAGDLGFRVILTTNGTLLPKRQEELLAAPALHKVNLSLHAPEANGVTEFTPYLTGCTDFLRAAAEKRLLCSLRLWNLDGADTVGQHRYNGQIVTALEQVFPQPWVKNTRGYRLADRVFLEWGEKFDWPDLQAPDRGGTCFCYGLRDQVAVLSDGTVVPCCLDREGAMALGNLFETPLEEILETSRARAIYDGFSRREAVEPLCRTCGFARRF